MGIDFSFLDFFDLCHRRNALCDPVIALGSLAINEPEAVIREFADKNPYWNSTEGPSVRSLFRDRYRVTHYRDCDLNDEADLKLDMNKPLNAEWVGSAMTVLNGGTMEHVFDVAQVIRNVHDMARPGGTIIHLSPISWYEHGYYNFNPRLFTAVGRANHYSLVAEAFWFPGNVLSESQAEDSQQRAATGHAHDIPHASATLRITFDGQDYTSWHEMISNLLAGKAIPADTLYLVAYRKAGQREFVMPYDVCG